uniref:Catesbeianin-1a protein n=1 Tax=Aquarana catesbeiana TaxID=8400 RepID=C4N9P7_AQUCT|nr:catesbeianin-1a protein precursor [Aquarana catesbeiana]
MFTMKKSLLLLFFLGALNFFFCGEGGDVDQDERRDDSGERNVQMEKRLFRHVVKIFEKYLGK